MTEVHKLLQKAEPFNGFARTYRKKDEEGEDFPPEKKKVSASVTELLKRVAKLETEAFDVEATKDWANCTAKADVVVEGRVLIAQAPATFLLFLEKQLSDLRTIATELPLLDEGEDWSVDPNSGLYRTEKTSTHKTKKVQRPIVMYEAVIKDNQALPAQTQMITEDQIVGWWDTVKVSGAIGKPRKEVLVERVDLLIRAVKTAREQANAVAAPPIQVGEAFFGYLFAAS